MKIYMHKSCWDVAFEVINEMHGQPGHVTLDGYWINLGYMGRPWKISPRQTVVLKQDVFNKWVDITNKADNVRLKPGLPE